MPRAAVFSTNFLDYSQTFVHEEVTHHQRYQVEVFCRKRMYPERFPFEPVHVGGPLYGVTRKSPHFDRLFAGGRFALVHGHFGTGSLYAQPFARRHRLPLVITFHGYDVPLLRSAARFQPQNWPYALLSRGLLHDLTLGLCASRELLEMLADYGVPRERLRLYHLGIDLGAFQPGQRKALARVLMVGRFVEKKGFEFGIRAFAACLGQGLRAELVIVGQGPREPLLRDLVLELGVGAAVRFTGALPSREVAALLADADVLMAPSVVGIHGDRESGVIVLKEASASQVAVLGTLHGGIPEVIDDGSTGYLVPERDVGALSARLGELLRDPALRSAMGSAGRAKMERQYDLTRQVQQLERLYDEAVALYRGAPPARG